ncbi:hypothetical protein LTR91_007366 [Friedmanniomyces endolithicus]|uniref:Uncharacterized protein n=1 Tax=Friedmanniomyces endolithicus TaxID=329885 RepID=A0AAN6KRL5_9PEZI|nr:hypothetical protein LTR94_000372 [Friedmanniomyces endolithicus]KAK0813146.1 hypothetical protein LTR75_004668 [Friedmanniomyces endolithicus]KAK0814844.1 hypothetical protein LTR59_000599 [Friedmanniomyces endolithicus]KAK0820336.1 hypothetical protein LTR38_000245 [Friedmanniomyces endolithicus]KAK0877384.1 hypothetical protein LTR87_008757 [Friedmanniomyces endolithicus]
MSSGLMETDPGGEDQQYEGNLHTADPHRKSAGQLGQSASESHTTTDPSQTDAGKQQAAERGEKTAENIRYGQTISETGGMGGMTQGMEGSTEQAGFGGGVGGTAEESGGADTRTLQGYGGKEDMSREVGG